MAKGSDSKRAVQQAAADIVPVINDSMQVSDEEAQDTSAAQLAAVKVMQS